MRAMEWTWSLAGAQSSENYSSVASGGQYNTWGDERRAITELIGLGSREQFIPHPDWMSSPFESRYADADLAIENWMTSPFKNTYAEAELILEDWMTSPFDAADHIEIESWMTAAF
jgi:hypothetical protein